MVILVTLVVAAIGGAFTWHVGDGQTDWAGFVAATAFFTAIALKGQLLHSRADEEWYEARAAAESAKSLAWRYAAGGEPFALDAGDAVETDRLFAARLHDVLVDLRRVALAHETVHRDQITNGMRQTRALALSDRRDAYLSDRIVDQREWYASKAIAHERRTQFWNWTLIAIEAVSGMGAILKATGEIDVDVLGLAAAASAGIIAWQQTRQDATLARAYSIAAHELAAIASLIHSQTTEEAWAKFCASAEEAISREHTLWRASRAGE